jgi:hypothetical protein
MKNVILFAVILASATVLKAQQQPTPDEIQLIQSAYGMEKRAIVEQYMKITEGEKASFWKLYDEYEAARKAYGQKRVKNLTEYANNYANLTDQKATELAKASLANQMEFTKLQQSTFGKMSKAMTAKRAAQFMQLESYLENIIRLKISDGIPFIGELEDIKKN